MEKIICLYKYWSPANNLEPATKNNTRAFVEELWRKGAESIPSPDLSFRANAHLTSYAYTVQPHMHLLPPDKLSRLSSSPPNRDHLPNMFTYSNVIAKGYNRKRC